MAQGYVFELPELKITSITRLGNGHIRLQCLGAPNQFNTIQATPDMLTSFTNLASVLADATGAFEFEDVNSGSFTKRFYRLSFP